MNEPSEVQSTSKFREYPTPTMTLWIEPPDLVCVRAVGDVTVEDVRETMRQVRELTKDWPHLINLVDQSQQLNMSAEARKAAAEGQATVPSLGTVFYGGSVVMRSIGQLVMRLINALSKNDSPVAFFKTEAEARAWIVTRRREVAAKK